MKNNGIDYVNFEINAVNEIVTDLYESMADNENATVVKCCNKLIYRLKEIIKDHKSE